MNHPIEGLRGETGRPVGLPSDRGTVVTVGTFDGVHRGHWRVLDEIRRRADASGRRSVVLTFDPHPLRVVRPDDAPPLLTTPREKKEILAQSGVEWTVFLRFTEALSRYEPERFVREVLVERLRVEELVVGYDHGFGRGRSGDADTLERVGREFGFGVDIVAPLAIESEPVSSTRIREALRAGRVDEAATALGRAYSLHGWVVEGDGRGRALGFPTANLRVEHPAKLVPDSGIYAVRAFFHGGRYDGALHVGPRPVFPGASSSIEVHLIDFEGSIYGEEVRVDFVRRLRGVRPFDSVEALVDRMREDVEEARLALE